MINEFEGHIISDGCVAEWTCGRGRVDVDAGSYIYFCLVLYICKHVYRRIYTKFK